MEPAEQIEQKLGFSLFKVGFRRLIKRTTIISGLNLRMQPPCKSVCCCGRDGNDSSSPTNKLDPGGGGEQGQRQSPTGDQWPVLNISGIPQLQTAAAGTSIGGSARSGRGPPKQDPRKLQRSLLIGYSCAVLARRPIGRARSSLDPRYRQAG